MKKYTLILAVLLLIMPLMANPVDIKTAQRVAETFMQAQTGTKAVLHQIEYTDQAEFPHFYVFGTENSFVIISADDCVQPVLGYSTENPFGTEKMPENLFWWLKGYDEQIADAAKSGLLASEKVSKSWEELASGTLSFMKDEPTAIAPLIQTKWDQDSPYNYFCSNGHGWITGCVATAMAQMMKYHNYPEIGIGSHSYPWSSQELSADFGATNYDWDNMINTYTNVNYSEKQRNAMATLMYHCGIAVEMKYSNGVSGSTIRRAATALNLFFNYNTLYLEKKNIDNSDWTSLLLEDLSNNRPVLYGGNVPAGGHAFICDGYDGNGKFHFNWGWHGNNDGYFLIDEEGGYLSPDDQVAAFNISPLSCLAQKPTDLFYTPVETDGITLTWTAGEGAVSYNIYRNNSLIASTEESSFTDYNATYGTNSYYVRSLDENDKLSLPSNSINVSIDYPTPIINDLHISEADNDVLLSWTPAPWCYPETESDALAYVDRIRPTLDRYVGWPEGDFCLFWGNRYLADNLTSLNGKAIYKVSIYTRVSGSFQVLLYQGTADEKIYPLELVASQSITTSGMGWIDVDFNNPLIIDSSQDLWVFIKETEGKLFTIPCIDDTGIDESRYFSTSDPIQSCGDLDSYNISWLIRTYLTDGIYTYNLYNNGSPVASNISDATYTVSNIANNTVHQYTVKTNYYGGESTPSNTAGLALGTASLESLELGENDKMNIAQNSTLTITVSLTNTNATNLVLEDGAQLIHNSDGVAATVKKSISSWTTDPVGGWYFIASPINGNELAPSNVTNMLTDANEENTTRTYDLYRLENDYWKNYRKNAFNLANGEGYLYANENAQTLSFKGEIKPYDIENNTVTISSGWNLIGNPYTCNVVPSLAYHILNNGASTTSVNANTGLITPGMGIAVYSENGGTLSFNLPTESASAPSNGNLQITLNQQFTNRNNANTIAIDNTIVSFDESEGLPKFPLLEANSKLYIPKDKEKYAIVSSAAQGEMPINFRVAEDGIYTLTVNPEGVEMNYLHLIDNLTGNDIDLLTSPDYTFEAKMTDYASRFKLVFNAKTTDGPSTPSTGSGTEGSGTFAYYADGEIRVIEACHGASLQVVDMTGRVIRCTGGACTVSTDGMTPGVYVLRLIDGENVKTQKIVIE